MAEAITKTASPILEPDDDFVTTQAEEQIAVATQWQLMWWRYRKHYLAMVGAIILILFYSAVVAADFLAYANPEATEAELSLVPPQPIQWFDNGRFSPYVYGFTGTRDPKTFKRVYTLDPNVKIPVKFFAEGFECRHSLIGQLLTNLFRRLGTDYGGVCAFNRDDIFAGGVA